MSAGVNVPSRRVLAELHHGDTPADGGGIAPDTSPALARAFARLDTALDAHAAAISALDRIEDALAATHGYPRVPLPAEDGTDATAHSASDTAAIARLLLMPTHAPADLVLKLTVLLTAGEPGPDDVRAFPWHYVGAILAELRGSDGAGPRR